MGNWRRVRIVGTCAPADLPALLAATAEPDLEDRSSRGEFHCLTRGHGIMGLHDWPAERMDVTGNLAERDYDVQDVTSRLEKLVKVAPSLALQVHCGGEYEADECVATVVVANGVVTVEAPQVPRVEPPSDGQVEENVQRAFLNAKTLGQVGRSGFDYAGECTKLARLVRLAATLEVDLDQIEATHGQADALSPFLDPTAWHRGGAQRLDEQRELIRLAAPFVRGSRAMLAKAKAGAK